MGNVNWPGVILCLAIGIPATVASSMYNPCGCCSECEGSSSSHLKTIAMLSIAAAFAAFAGSVTCAVFVGNLASWPAPKCYVCCPDNATELTLDSCLTESNKYGEKDCSSPNGKKGYDCIAGGPWPPMSFREETMTCFNKKVVVETKAKKGEKDFFKGVQTYLLIFMGIGLTIYAMSLFATVLPAYFTWKEAMQRQNMEMAGGPA